MRMQFEWVKLEELAGADLQADIERRIDEAKAELAEQAEQARQARLAAEQARAAELAEQAANAAAAAERQRGLADESMQPGTRLRLPADGDGSYERWESSWMGGNRHFVRFDLTGETKKIVLSKLNPDDWQVRQVNTNIYIIYNTLHHMEYIAIVR